MRFRTAIIAATGATLASSINAAILTYDLRVSGTGLKSATLVNPDDPVTLDLFAIVSGADNDAGNDGFHYNSGSFKSSEGGLLGDLIIVAKVAPFDFLAAQLGVQADLDGDGDLDIGTNDTSVFSGDYVWSAHSGFSPVLSAPPDGFHIGQIQFKPATDASGSTEINFMPRIRTDGSFVARRPHKVIVDGTGVYLEGNNPSLELRGPVHITYAGRTVIGDGTVQMLSGTINEHLSVGGRAYAAEGATVTIATGVDVANDALLDLRDAGGGYGSHAVYVDDTISGNAGGQLVVGQMTVGRVSDGYFAHSGGSTQVGSHFLVGDQATSNGVVQVTAGEVSSPLFTIAHKGSGAVNHSGGRITVNQLDMANATGVSSDYELTGAAELRVSGDAHIGATGKGTFRQSGGNSTFLGDTYLGFNGSLSGAPADGNITLSAGSLEAEDIFVGYSGTGTVHQFGGSLNAYRLYLGHASRTSEGTYTLDNGDLSAAHASIGHHEYGTGRFTQNSGRFEIRRFGSLLVRRSTNGIASRYELNGGDVVADAIYVGGILTQNGGSSHSRYLHTGSGGQYDLNEGHVSTWRLTVGEHQNTGTEPGTGLFVQNGGSIQTDYVVIQPGARFEYRGGTLNISGQMTNSGEFDFTNSPVWLNLGGNVIADFSKGTIANGSNANISAGAGSVITFAAGYDWESEVGQIVTDGFIHINGQSLTIPATKSLGGTGAIEGDVTNHGLLSPGNSPGQLAITGNLTQTQEASMLIELAGTDTEQFDYISVSGLATLAGELELALLGDFVPSASDSFTILSASGLSGSFGSIVSNSVRFDVLYSGNSVTLTNFQAVPEPGIGGLAALVGVLGLRRSRRRRA